MSTLIDFYNNWLPKEKEITLILIHPNVEELIQIALSHQNITKILYTGKSVIIDDKRFQKYNEKEITSSSYVFINFSKSDGLPGENLGVVSQTGELKDLSYLFKKPVWKKHVTSFLIYNYNGQRPINDFWIADSHNYADFFICERSSWAMMTQELKPNELNSDSIMWRNNLKIYLKTILKYIVEEDYISKFLEEQYFHIWVRSFIHKSYNILYNYDPVEYYGDSISKFCFRQYMIEKYPRFVARELTEYSNQYMSEVYQHVFSDDMNLVSWLLCDPSIKNFLLNSPKTKTDVLEAFSGSLAKIGDLISPGIGTIACRNFYIILGESLPFPKSMAYGIYITQVGQINEKLGFSKNTTPNKNPQELFNEFKSEKQKAFVLFHETINVKNNKGEENSVNRSTIQFNPSFLSFLSKKGINTTILTEKFNSDWHYDQIFNEDVKESKKEANDAIYDQIYRIYNLAGITQDFSQQNKRDIFDGIDRDLISLLKISINDDEKFKKIDFYIDAQLGIVIMYLDIYPSSSAYSGRDTLSHEIENQTNTINPQNLAVVPFATSVPQEFRGKMTNTTYSKCQAILKYLNKL